ncbi:MAG: OsmC family protein [Candidatus Helarchaeota archaeon]
MPARVRATWLKNLQFEASIKDFPKFIMDEPEQFHGDDTGPSSIELMLSGIAGCIGTSFIYCLNRFGCKYDGLVVETTGEIHHNAQNLLRITNIGISMEIKADTDDEDNLENIQVCYEHFAKYCVVTKSVEQGIPFDLKLNFKSSKND